MACGDLGRYANAGNLLGQTGRFLLSRDEAVQIVGNMEAQIRLTWYDTARGSGVSDSDFIQIAGAFAYPGFRT
jgi:serine/threonine-protein kinase HipA